MCLFRLDGSPHFWKLIRASEQHLGWNVFKIGFSIERDKIKERGTTRRINRREQHVENDSENYIQHTA